MVALRSGTLTIDQPVTFAGLLVLNGAKVTHTATPSNTSPKKVDLTVNGPLYVGCGGSIDVSGAGYAPGVTYPGAGLPGSDTGGSHLGESGVFLAPAAETFGSVVRPQENGGGSRTYSRGGGTVRIVAQRVQVDGAIQANGGNPGGSWDGGAGGSVWITTQALAGTGTINASGGTPQNGRGSGGGGAISVEYTTLEAGTTVLSNTTARGGLAVTGGAGTVYVKSGSSTFGSLTVNNGTVSGNKRTILPSLGSGTAQPGSGGATLVTDRTKAIPAYFLGHWVEIRDAGGATVKGTWRVASIAANGLTVTLSSDSGAAVTVAAGDRWQGVYRFDQVTVGSTSVLVSADPVVQLVPPLPQTIGRARSAARANDGYDALYGNEEAPAWDKAAVSIAVGSIPGSYRITLAPAAVSDSDGISEVSLASGGRSVSAAWSAEGTSFLWAGRSGQRLHLVATDAHARFRRSGWLELPPLPSGDLAGGWEAQLELAAGMTPLAVAGGADWLAVADSGVWLYGAELQPTDTVPPRTKGEEVTLLASGEPLLFAATRDRVDLLDRTVRALREVRMPAGTAVLDVAPAGGGAMLLVSDTSDPARPALRLMELLASEGETPSLSVASEQALPLLAEPVLHRTDGFLHLFGLAPNGNGVLYTWPSDTPDEPLSAVPQAFAIPAGWRALGPWERGAVLLDGTAVRLYEHGTLGWSEVSHIDLVSASAAAVAGDKLVVIVPGEIQVYDVSNAAAPVLEGRYPGSSYRQVTPLAGGEVLLWSPRMATPPLRWNPATAVSGDRGDGFHTVIDGLP